MRLAEEPTWYTTTKRQLRIPSGLLLQCTESVPEANERVLTSTNRPRATGNSASHRQHRCLLNILKEGGNQIVFNMAGAAADEPDEPHRGLRAHAGVVPLVCRHLDVAGR